jgi:tRNA-dihydrouridine synthase C
MQILLAPMEGLLDFTLRDVLTRIGGVDRCVSEFIRITDTLLPPKAFLRIVPELANAGCTPAGTPVRAQLLGSDPVCMAENAARLAELGPYGIDLNFGCPAKVVNRSGGGALMLQTPEALEDVVSAVRRAVPAHLPVSAKMRLGYHDDSLAEVCAQAIEAGGADELVVHARTRDQGYKPPAYWDRIAAVRQAVRIPVVANGEVWTVADALRCLQESGCDSLMLGRGIVADPGLAWAIRAAVAGHDAQEAAGLKRVRWHTDIQPLLAVYWDLVHGHVVARHRAGRVKQWLHYLRRAHPEARAVFEQVRTLTDSRDVDSCLRSLHTAPPLCPG